MLRWIHMLCAALAIALAGCSPRGSGPAASSSHPDTATRAIGARADSLVFPVVRATAGEVQAMAARPGARATLVNVWATWCAPCREEFPALMRVSRAHASDGLRLVLVSADFSDQLPAVRRFLSAQGVSDTTYIKSGEDMAFINALNPKWSGALPATLLYDADGRLTTFWEGISDEARFERAVRRALAQPSTEKDSQP